MKTKNMLGLLVLVIVIGITGCNMETSCAQSDPDICQGLADGDSVPSCDSCNTCACNQGFAACTEIGCEG